MLICEEEKCHYNSRETDEQPNSTTVSSNMVCVYMNVGTMVALLFYVYNNKPVALKKVNPVFPCLLLYPQ